MGCVVGDRWFFAFELLAAILGRLLVFMVRLCGGVCLRCCLGLVFCGFGFVVGLVCGFVRDLICGWFGACWWTDWLAGSCGLLGFLVGGEFGIKWGCGLGYVGLALSGGCFGFAVWFLLPCGCCVRCCGLIWLLLPYTARLRLDGV